MIKFLMLITSLAGGGAEKVFELFGNEVLRVRFSKNALESSKKYDWDVVVEKYVELIRRRVEEAYRK